jgi:hypothetical protein
VHLARPKRAPHLRGESFNPYECLPRTYRGELVVKVVRYLKRMWGRVGGGEIFQWQLSLPESCKSCPPGDDLPAAASRVEGELQDTAGGGVAHLAMGFDGLKRTMLLTTAGA